MSVWLTACLATSHMAGWLAGLRRRYDEHGGFLRTALPSFRLARVDPKSNEAKLKKGSREDRGLNVQTVVCGPWPRSSASSCQEGTACGHACSCYAGCLSYWASKMTVECAPLGEARSHG